MRVLRLSNSAILSVLLILLLASCANRQPVVEQNLSQGWTLTSDTLDINLSVDVPSVVQQSLYEAELIPHPYMGTVENDLLWIADHPWTYSLDFTTDSKLLEQDRVELVFDGIDTYADVILNGTKLFTANNQFRTWKADVKSLLKAKDNHLEVFFPRYDSLQQAAYDQATPRFPEKYAVSRKAPYQHGWDWAPKYKNVGVWKPVRLLAWSETRLEHAYMVTKKADAEQATLSLHLDLDSRAPGEVVVVVLNDKEVLQRIPVTLQQGEQHKVFDLVVDNPMLWWPNEMGEQPLYDFDIRLEKNGKLMDERHIRTGIKTFEMVEELDDVGFSFYFKVNGVPMYSKGANYIPEEMIETWMQPDHTLRLLQEAKKAHFNMLRVWGGGVYPADDFFQCCDSLGILVWEDFMYAGSMYPYDEAFLENAKIEALEQVKRLASHPSLALWCGGNEISEGYYNWGWQQSLGWSKEDDLAMKAGYDRLFEEILARVVSTYDGSRPYWPSSPSKGWGRPESLTQGDVHYWGVWWGEQPYEVYREKVGRFNSEYGYQSYPDVQTLKQAAGDDASFKSLCDYQGDSIYPLIADNAFLNAHEKHVRGIRQINDFIMRYYPEPMTLDDYVYYSQLSQAYGMEIAIEAHRTAKPYNMGTLYWQLNDAWPVISWSSVDYYGRPKALQYKLKTLYAPVLLSLDPQLSQVIVTSDLMEGVRGELKVAVCDFNGTALFEQIVKVELTANQNKRCYVEGLSQCLSTLEKQKVYVKLELVDAGNLLSQRFCYLVSPKDLELPEAKLDLSTLTQEGKIIVEVKSDVFAKDVRLSVVSGSGSFSDNYFDLEPGESRQVVFIPEDPKTFFSFSARSL